MKKDYGRKVDKKNKTGFYYCLSEETIRKYMSLSPAMKLKWLEEANRFTRKALTSKTRRIWQQFRRGEI